MTTYTKLDAADELRRIGPQISAAIRELDRLCVRLPQDLVGRLEEACPELVHYDVNTGTRISQLAQALQEEINEMPEEDYEAMLLVIEARRRALRAQQCEKVVPMASRRGLAFGVPPGIAHDDILPPGAA